MMIGRFFGAQVVGETLDWGFDWSAWLITGDSIASSAWTAEGTITMDSDGVSGETTYVWLSGGEEDTVVRLTNTIETADGRTAIRQIDLRLF